MNEPLDLEEIEARLADRRLSELYAMGRVRADTVALIAEVRRLRGVVCDLLDDRGAGMAKTRAALVGPTGRADPPTRDELFTTG